MTVIVTLHKSSAKLYLLELFRLELLNLQFESKQNSNSPINEFLTASKGLAEMVSSNGTGENELIGKADNMFYRAKNNGRNRL